jgi:hypothetical protein
VASLPGVAGATLHTVWTMGVDSWPIFARAYESETSGGLEDWSGFRVGQNRAPNATPWNTICAYQAWIAWQSPNGQTTYSSQFSPFHGSCSYVAWMDFPNYNGLYVENTRFPTKWKSDKTPNSDWLSIGVLTD